MIIVERTNERFSLKMVIVPMGMDYNVSLYGGDAPHIGAVAMAIPHPGLRTEDKIDASVSLLAVTGHKEDELARRLAFALATHSNGVVSVACGIHLDDATPDEIQQILDTADEMMQEALTEL